MSDRALEQLNLTSSVSGGYFHACRDHIADGVEGDPQAISCPVEDIASEMRLRCARSTNDGFSRTAASGVVEDKRLELDHHLVWSCRD